MGQEYFSAQLHIRKRQRGIYTNSENVSFHSNTHTQWRNIQEKKTFSLLTSSMVSQHGSLNSSAKSNTLIRIDRFIQSTSTKYIGHEFLNLGNTSGSTDQDNIVNIRFIDLGILENRFHGSNSLLEDFVVDSFESSSSDGRCEIMSLV